MHKYKKNLPTVGEPPYHTLPRSVALLPHFGPPLTNLGYNTVTEVAKGAQGAMPPLIGE